MTENGDERELPEGWEWVQVGEIGTIVTGSTPSTKYDEYYGGPHPFYKPSDLNAGYYTKSAESDLTDEGLAVSRPLPEGTIAVTCIGATIGKTGLLRSPGATNQQINAIVPEEGVVPEYIYFACVTPDFQSQIKERASSTTLPILNKSKFSRLSLPLAPLAEQRRIVDTIEELFSDLDAGVKALETVRRQLDRYRQSVLKAAVEGDLTREWREQHGADAEPADALLDRILDERRARWETDYAAKYEAKGKTPPKGWQSRYKEPEAPDSGDLSELPKGWEWASVDQLIRETLRNGKSGRTAEDGVRVLTLTAVTEGDFSEANTKIAAIESDAVTDLWLTDGDILIERSNTPELVGTARLYRGPDNFAVFPDLIIRARFSTGVIDRFAEIVLQAESARHYFQREARGMSGSMPKISQSTIEALDFPLPPLAEQEAIVEEVEQRLSVVDAVAAEVDRQLARAGRLRRAILQHAFDGKLVPQEARVNTDGDEVGERVEHSQGGHSVQMSLELE